jgi:hypothetical protein
MARRGDFAFECPALMAESGMPFQLFIFMFNKAELSMKKFGSCFVV